MKRRMFALLFALVLCLGLLPMGAMAANTPAEPMEGTATSVTVDFTAQAEGSFLFAP